MDLYLRKVMHPQARDNYRVILKDDGIPISALYPHRWARSDGTSRR
jgi:hypothetical protein